MENAISTQSFISRNNQAPCFEPPPSKTQWSFVEKPFKREAIKREASNFSNASHQPPANGNASNMWNGNIAGIQWSSPTFNNLGFRYTYDAVNRLTSSTTNYAGVENGNFYSSYTYNKNGNFTSALVTNVNSSPIDQLTYGYLANSNQLSYVQDYMGDVAGVDDFPGNTSTSQQMVYDANGNVTSDSYRAVSIAYNSLNLPAEMDFVSNKKIAYIYTASGEKQVREVTDGANPTVRTYYRGPFVYTQTGSVAGSLNYISTPEGRLVNTGTYSAPVWKWEYNLTDHLGNVRAVITPDATRAGYSTWLQQTNYYPFGMKISSLSSALTTTNNDLLYNGKELQDDFGLNWYDYGARFYDPALGRWHSVDALAEDYYDLSPYNYAGNNPICYIDPDGNFKTRFGAWLYSVFNGGGDILQDKGGEYFVGQKVETEGDADITYKRSFDWGGRGEGKDLALEAQTDAFITQDNFARTLDQAGIEYSYTNNRGEALRSMVGLSTMGLLPNPLLKSATALVNGGKAAKNTETLLSAGNAADRGGLTAAGRALQKHGSRSGSVFPKVSGNSSALNQQGESVLKSIITNPSATKTIRHHSRFGNIMDIQIPGGQGARFSVDGKKFIHFLEP